MPFHSASLCTSPDIVWLGERVRMCLRKYIFHFCNGECKNGKWNMTDLEDRCPSALQTRSVWQAGNRQPLGSTDELIHNKTFSGRTVVSGPITANHSCIGTHTVCPSATRSLHTAHVHGPCTHSSSEMMIMYDWQNCVGQRVLGLLQCTPSRMYSTSQKVGHIFPRKYTHAHTHTK